MVSVAILLMVIRVDARVAGAETIAKKTSTSVRHPHVSMDGVWTALQLTAATVWQVGTGETARST